MSKTFKKGWSELSKNTVHITYDKNGVPVNSYVDEEEGAEKAMTNGETDNPREDAEFGDDVEKPGDSIHSKEWDDCVREVQAGQEKTGGKVNAFAVCTAKLSDKAYKSEVRHLSYIKSEIKKAQKEVEKMGIEGAGSVPNSLLARQDLEGEADDEENRVQNDKNDVGQN